jgi:hypothetical protein
VVSNFKIEENKIKMLLKYKIIAQKVLCDKLLFVALLSGRKYDVIHQNGDS